VRSVGAALRIGMLQPPRGDGADSNYPLKTSKSLRDPQILWLDRRWRQQIGLKLSDASEINGLPDAKVAVGRTRNQQRAQEAANSIPQPT
jgi:hypothetical protein